MITMVVGVIVLMLTSVSVWADGVEKIVKGPTGWGTAPINSESYVALLGEPAQDYLVYGARTDGGFDEIVWTGSSWVTQRYLPNKFYVAFANRPQAAKHFYGALKGGGLEEIIWTGSAWSTATINNKSYVALVSEPQVDYHFYGALTGGGLDEIFWGNGQWNTVTFLTNKSYVALTDRTLGQDHFYGALEGGGLEEIMWIGGAWRTATMNNKSYVALAEDPQVSDYYLYGALASGGLEEIKWGAGWETAPINNRSYVALADRPQATYDIYGAFIPTTTTGVYYDLGGNWSSTTHQLSTYNNECWNYSRIKWVSPNSFHRAPGAYSGWIVFKYISAMPIDRASFHIDNANINISANVKFAIAVSTDNVNYTDILTITGPYQSPSGGELLAATTPDMNYATKIYLKLYSADLGGGTQFFFSASERPETGTPYTFYSETINDVPYTSSFGEGLMLGSGAGAWNLATMAATAGIALSRQNYEWTVFESTADDNYQWEEYDESTNFLEQKWIKPCPVFAHWPSWTTPDTQTGWNQYADSLTDLINRYKPRIKHWEIWNEPDGGAMTASNYYNLLKTAYTAAKVKDPNCKIVAPVVDASSLAWVQTLVGLGGFNYMDIFSIHKYPRPLSGSPESCDFVASIKGWKQYLVANNGPSEFWITEMGWNTDKPGNFGGRPAAVTQAEQARYIVRGYILSLSAGANKVYQFMFVNDVPGAEPYGYGLLDSSGNPKLSYYAFRTMTNELEGYNYSSELDLGTNAKGYVFTNGTSRRVVVWSLTGTRNIKLDINATVSTIVQLDGTSAAGSMSGNVLSLNLKEDPQFIEGASGAITVVQSNYDLVADSSFEDFTWWLSNPTYITKDTLEYHTKNASCKITQQGIAEPYAYSNDFKVNPDRNYTLSIWIKTQDIYSSKPAVVNVMELGGAGQSWYLNASGSNDLIAVSGTTAWTNYQYTLNNIKDTTWGLRVYVRTYKRSGSTRYAWFDDVKVVRTPDDQDNNLVDYGDMECGRANMWLGVNSDKTLWPVDTTGIEGDFSGKLPGKGIENYAFSYGGAVNGTGTITYTLSASIKTENITPAKGASINVAQYAGSEPRGWYYISGDYRLISSDGTTDWRRGSVTLDFANDITGVTVYVRNEDPDSDAIAYFDEILLIQNN